MWLWEWPWLWSLSVIVGVAVEESNNYYCPYQFGSDVLVEAEVLEIGANVQFPAHFVHLRPHVFSQIFKLDESNRWG